jgi:CBS domain-containing protein
MGDGSREASRGTSARCRIVLKSLYLMKGELIQPPRLETMTVEDLMSSKVITTHGDRTLGEVRCNMLENKIHAVPVVDFEQKPVGILTSTDLLGDVVSDEMRVALFPTPKVYAVSRDETVSNAAKLMRKYHLHHLIVAEDDKIVGIVSTYDLLEVVA